MIEKLLLFDKEKNIYFIGSSWFVFLNSEERINIGFPKGQIENGDVFIYLRFLPDDDFYKQLQCSIETGGVVSKDTLSKLAILIGKYGDGEMNLLHLNEESLPLSTEYLNRSISIQKVKRKHQVCIEGETFYLDSNNTTEFISIVADQGIKYVNQTAMTDGDMGLIDIIKGSEYGASKDCVLLGGKKTIEIFIPLLTDLLDRTIDSEYLALGKETYVFSRRYSALHGLSIFSAETIEDLEESTKNNLIKIEKMDAIKKQKKIAEHYFTSNNVLGQGKEIQKIKELLDKAAPSEVGILLTGESGTGKTYIAKEIHKASRRKMGPYIHVNCASIPYSLIESELFGYDAGAFTGASREGKKGYFELADGGTIFLDEISELPIELQGRLLEVIQSKTFYRVGGSKKVEIDVRVIAATNRSLEELVEERKFREDLLYRICVFAIELPPLRDRLADIPVMVKNLLPRICARNKLNPILISENAISKLLMYHWPGNIRELENILEKASILCDGSIITERDIAFPIATEEEMDNGLKNSIERYESMLLQRALNEHSGNRTKVARELNISRTTLFEKMKKYGLFGGEDD